MQAANAPATADSTRERILSAARKVFLDGPPEAATMDALAQQAGMSKKTIYREFKSQLELLTALANEAVAENAEFAPPTPDSDIELELYGMLTRLVSLLMSPRSIALARLLISEVRRYPELVQRDRKEDFPRKVVAKWLAAPAVRTRYQIEDPDDAAAMLLGMVIQDAAFRLLLTECESMPAHIIEQRTRRAVAIFLRGVRKGAG